MTRKYDYKSNFICKAFRQVRGEGATRAQVLVYDQNMNGLGFLEIPTFKDPGIRDFFEANPGISRDPGTDFLTPLTY